MTSPCVVAFEALDTLWFREGRSFDQTDDGLAEARAIFPPSPTTLAGALVAALHQPLRSPPEALCISGPFLTDCERLFVPAPSTLMRREAAAKTGWAELRDLVAVFPAEQLTLPGDAWLPRPVALPLSAKEGTDDLSDLETLSGSFIDAEDFFSHMEDTFLNKTPGIKLVERSHVVVPEPRIGITLQAELRSAEPGMLFAGQHLRPARDDPKLLCVELTGADETLLNLIDGSTVPLGGRGRMCRLRVLRDLSLLQARSSSAARSMPEKQRHQAPPKAKGEVFHFRLTALSPVPLTSDYQGEADRYGLGVPSGNADWCAELKVHTAIMPSRPVVVGRGASDAGPASLHYAHPAGTTWFVSLPKAKMSGLNLIEEVDKVRFAPQPLDAIGFGRMAAGEWPMGIPLNNVTQRRKK